MSCERPVYIGPTIRNSTKKAGAVRADLFLSSDLAGADPRDSHKHRLLLQVIVLDVLFDPPEPVAVRVTTKLSRAANVCEVVTPVPVPPSPKFQLYDDAFVEELASKLQVKREQL